MNKVQYIEALEKALHKNNVADVSDVLADYEAHFSRKALDGYSEEEIAHRLGNPEEIAADFRLEDAVQVKNSASKGRGFIWLGLCCADLFVMMFFLLLFIWAAGMLIASISVLVLGVYIALGTTWLSITPYMPTAGRILMGLCIIVLSGLLFAGSGWFYLLAKQMMRAYMRWHSNRWYGRHELALPVMPQLTGKTRRILRRVVLIALISFVVLVAAGYFVLSFQAGTFEFWHHWQWFEAV